METRESTVAKAKSRECGHFTDADADAETPPMLHIFIVVTQPSNTVCTEINKVPVIQCARHWRGLAPVRGAVAVTRPELHVLIHDVKPTPVVTVTVVNGVTASNLDVRIAPRIDDGSVGLLLHIRPGDDLHDRNGLVVADPVQGPL